GPGAPPPTAAEVAQASHQSLRRNTRKANGVGFPLACIVHNIFEASSVLGMGETAGWSSAAAGQSHLAERADGRLSHLL
ncbi:MAG: hypothetical protein WBG91_12750, partial [Syntrophobacteria bacterium]